VLSGDDVALKIQADVYRFSVPHSGAAPDYERREPNWIVVSGYKGNRIFYRRATRACENRQWHHIAFFADRCHWLYLNVVMQKKKPCAGGSAGFHLSTGFGPLRSRRLSVHALINWIIPPLSFSSGRRQQRLPDEMTYFQERR
jgi:hypothetical protein